MTREYVKIMLPLMQAFAEGKTLQYRVNEVNNEWKDINNPAFNDLSSEYRIKPEPKYRPFRTNEECWNEMHKHPDFGWVIRNGVFLMVQSIYLDAIDTIEDKHGIDFKDAFTELTFTDGAPFGIKEE